MIFINPNRSLFWSFLILTASSRLFLMLLLMIYLLTVFHMLATIGQRIHSNWFGGISSNPLCGYSDDHPLSILIPWHSKSSTEVAWLLNKSWLKAHVAGCLNCHAVAWRNPFQFIHGYSDGHPYAFVYFNYMTYNMTIK